MTRRAAVASQAAERALTCASSSPAPPDSSAPISSKALNRRGVREIVAVDNLARSEKFVNLVDCEIEEFVDKDDFLARIADGDFDDDIGAVLHEGACSDTMEVDGRYMMRNNYRYSVALLDWCQSNDVPFLYASSASVYGDGTVFREERAYETPLNVYAYSKFLFDQHVRRLLARAHRADRPGSAISTSTGPREQHKGRGASVACHFCRQYREHGPRLAVRRLGRLRRRRTAPRLRRRRTTWST
jgi:ADP-L-glycero-D-manno-heptose 6-epimerase